MWRKLSQERYNKALTGFPTHLFGDVAPVVLLGVQVERVRQQRGLHDHQVAPLGLPVAAFDLHLGHQLRNEQCKAYTTPENKNKYQNTRSQEESIYSLHAAVSKGKARIRRSRVCNSANTESYVLQQFTTTPTVPRQRQSGREGPSASLLPCPRSCPLQPALR